MFKPKVIIVGSGPTAVMAAASFIKRGIYTLMLDVGDTQGISVPEEGNLYDLKRHDGSQFSWLIGDAFENVDLVGDGSKNVRVRSPSGRFVVQSSKRHFPMESDTFFPTVSYARGGLANVWGAVTHKFGRDELEGLPISVADMTPYYEQLTAYMGISGAGDDLDRFLGSSEGLQPPLEMEPNAAGLLAAYEHRRSWFNRRGLFFGRPRMAVLTKPHGGRSAYAYDNMEFLRTHDPAIYNPEFTLRELEKSEYFTYMSGLLVETFAERQGMVDVYAKEIASGKTVRFEGQKLVLAAGALNTGKIVLASRKAYEVRLPLLDNPTALIPFINLRRIGYPLQTHAFGLSQLAFAWKGAKDSELIQGNIYAYTAGLRSDLVFDFPLSVRGNLAMAKYVLPAFSVLQVFYPDHGNDRNYLALRKDGTVELAYLADFADHSIEHVLIGSLRRCGFIGHSRLIRRPGPGKGSHYAGMLPMAISGGQFSVNKDCLLAGERSTYVVDGSILPSLPSKQYTFFLMANAMRVAEKIRF